MPKLPENAPNFSSQVDFGSYQAPVVVIPEPDPEPEPEPEPEPILANLVDTTDSPPPIPSREPEPRHQHASPPPSQHPTVDFELILRDRDELIRHLQSEIDRLGYVYQFF